MVDPYRRIRSRLIRLAGAAFAVGLAFGAAAAPPAVPADQPAAVLQAQYASLAGRLRHSPFRRALSLDSTESSTDLKGEIHAVVDYPFSMVSAALDAPEPWCDVLILHLNTKYCHAATDATHTVLTVGLGRKTAQPLKDATPIAFTWRVSAATTNYLAIQLVAPAGPLNTRNFRIELRAIPVGRDQSFLHLTYAYDYGMAGRLAMQAYLATLGSGKVGFTQVGQTTGGPPDYVRGMRGLVERNTMRYYLAIDAYLGALASPPPAQLHKRLHSWFNATEQYPRQLREISWAAYLEMKQGEALRQRGLQ